MTRDALDLFEDRKNLRGKSPREIFREVRRVVTKRDTDRAGDAVGWGVGNAVGSTAGIPLSGASVAMPVAPSVVEGIQKARETLRSTGKVKEAAREGLKTTREGVRRRVNRLSPVQGAARERKVYEAVNNQLKQDLPELPPGINFSIHFNRLCT